MTQHIRTSFDVAIVGGGPGGSATALSLRTHAPDLSVVLIEASHYNEIRIGETLPPQVRPILEHLGVWDAFRKQGHREVYGTTSAWGSSFLVDNDFMYMPGSIGWHIDRPAFDGMLARQAESRGLRLILDDRVRDSRRANNEWRMELSSGDTIAARFIVDATGGSALMARQFGTRFISADKLIGIGGFFERGDGDPRTLVEAFEDGWWYTAVLPNERRIVVCMTDSDVARRMRLHDTKVWHRKLADMSNVGAMVEDIQCNALVSRPAGSRRLDPVAGEDWLAVGDSASRFDPLSSQGIVKALRSGIFASYAIGDLLTRNDVSGLERYRRFVLQEFDGYIEMRKKYYCEEHRWPASEFWLRRQQDQGAATTLAS